VPSQTSRNQVKQSQLSRQLAGAQDKDRWINK